jgi:hypothetical protein
METINIVKPNLLTRILSWVCHFGRVIKYSISEDFDVENVYGDSFYYNKKENG